MDSSVRYTDNSFNVNDGRFTKAVQGSHYMFIPKLDAANKEYRKQNKESKNQDQLKMLFCNEKQNDCTNYSKNNPIGTKFESHYPTLLRLPTDRSYDDIKRGVKPNVEEELSNAADRYSKDTSSDMSSKSNIDCNYYFEDETSSEVVHKFAGRLKTDNVTKKSTAKNIKSIHRKEDKTDQKNKDLTPTKRSLKRRHVLSENFMNGKLIKKNDLTGDNPKTEVKTFKRYRLKNNNIHNKNSDSNISKVFQLTKTNNIKSFDDTIQSLDKSFHINKSVKKLEKVSIYDLNEYENYDNTVKNTTLSTIWEAFPRDENSFTGGFSTELHNKKGIFVYSTKFCAPQVISKSKGAATSSITCKEKIEPQTKINQNRLNNRGTNNQDSFMSKTYKTVNIFTHHQTIYNAEKSNAKTHRYDGQSDDDISSLGNANDNLGRDNCIDAQFIKEKVAVTIDNDETLNRGIGENPHVANDKGSSEKISSNITKHQMDSNDKDNNADNNTTESNAVIRNHIEIDTCSAVKLTQVTTASKALHVDIEENSVTNVTSNGNFIIPKLIVENYVENSDSTCNETDYKNKNIATKAATNSDARKIITNNPTEKNCSNSMFKRYKLSEKHDVTNTTSDGYVDNNNKRDTHVDHVHATVELNFEELRLDDRKREKARHCAIAISRNVANIHKLVRLFKMRITNAFGKRSSLSTFVAFKEKQFRENYGDFLESTDNTNTDEEDWDVLCYSLYLRRLENSRSK